MKLLLFLFIAMSILFLIDKENPFIKIAYFIYTSIFLFIRYGFGADYFSYMNLYNQFNPKNFGVGSKIEFGYKLIMAPFRLMNLPYWVFLGVISTLILILIAFWIESSSKNKSVSYIMYLSLFFIVWNNSALRQGIVLAIGTNIIFNKRINLNDRYKVLSIILLSSIHLSALFYLVILALNKIRWNKKRLLYFLVASYIFSFIPFAKIATQFAFIPSIKILLDNYLSSNVNFLDFPSIIRLLFFMLHIYLFDKIEKNEYENYILTNFILGIGLYNVFKFSEITASRLGIYTFILLIITSALIFEYIKVAYSNINKLVLKAVFIIVAFVFFYKESTTYIIQSGIEGSQSVYNIETIFDGTADIFNQKQAFIERQKNFCKFDRESFLNNINDTEIGAYDKNHTYVMIRDPKSNKYGVLSSQGKWLIEPSFDKNGEVVKDILKFNKKSEIFDEFDYIDLSNKNRTIDELEKDSFINKINIEEELILKQLKVEFNKEEVNEIVNTVVPRTDLISSPELILMKYTNFEHYIYKFYYYGDRYYIYLNDDLTLMSPYMHRYAVKMNESLMINLSTDCGRIIINRDGEIIWHQ